MQISSRRIFWLVIILALLAVYFVINRFVSGGRALALPVDKHIPLFPPAIIPYLAGSVLFVAFPVWASLYAPRGRYEAYLISFLTATIVSYIIYLALPTYVIRPEVESGDFLSRAVALLYRHDFPQNAAPSGHTFYTTISFFYFRLWQPRYWGIALIIAIMIIASTLLTKQHYVLDVIAGLALGIISYGLGRYAQKRWSLEFAS
ncbi:MAG: phosphatase PAP2 family protein [Dehalococcoidales bacterium]|jgi:membrane-associated phospholipid phosphatase